MTKDVLVRVRGIQFIQDSRDAEEPIEIVTPGTYEYKDGVHKVVYEETYEGFENEPTVNTVTISDKCVIVQKVGAITVDMVFEPGKRSLAYYTTPFGTLDMGISTTDVKVEESEYRIDVRAEYSLSMNDELVSEFMLDMSIDAK